MCDTIAPAADEVPNAKVPKQVVNARKTLQENGVELSEIQPADLLKLPKKQVNDLFNALRYNLRSRGEGDKVCEQYAAIKCDRERREWLSRFLVDPSCGGCEGSSQTTLDKVKEEQEEVPWQTSVVSETCEKVLCFWRAPSIGAGLISSGEWHRAQRIWAREEKLSPGPNVQFVGRSISWLIDFPRIHVSLAPLKCTCEVHWVTLKQLAGPRWLNDMEAATIVAESGDPNERPHRFQD